MQRSQQSRGSASPSVGGTPSSANLHATVNSVSSRDSKQEKVLKGLPAYMIARPGNLSLPVNQSSCDTLILPPTTPPGADRATSLMHLVPRWLLDHLAGFGERDELDATRMERSAAVLCIDLVGFTALTDNLSSSGSAEGADNISSVLNTFFAKVLDVIEQFDGDVIQFSGDAVMALFHTQKDVDTNSVLCLKCAQAIGASISSAKVTLLGQCVEVTLKLGIAAGDLSLMVCGGHRGKWQTLCGGVAWNQAAAACSICPPAHLVVHPSCTHILKRRNVMDSSCYSSKKTVDVDGGKGVMLAPPFAEVTRPPRRGGVPTLSDDAKQMLKTFLFKGVVKQHRNDVRNVVTVFIKFCDVSCPSESNWIKLQHLSLTIQRLCHKYNGVCNKLLFDDKGLLALICFGLPQYVHSDDAERACHVATEIVDQLEGDVGRICVGIARNRVYCGELGNSFRAEYTVLGDSVNLSSRLLSLGYTLWQASCVLVDEAVYLEIRDIVQFDDTRRVTVKGKSEPILACTLNLRSMRERGDFSVLSPASSTSSRSRRSPRSMLRSRTSSVSTSSGELGSRQSSRSVISLRHSRGKRTAGSHSELWHPQCVSPEMKALVTTRTRSNPRLRSRKSETSSVNNTSRPSLDSDAEVMVGRAYAKRQFHNFMMGLTSRSSVKGKLNSSKRTQKSSPITSAQEESPAGSPLALDPYQKPGMSPLATSQSDSEMLGVDAQVAAMSPRGDNTPRYFIIEGSVGMGKTTTLRHLHNFESARYGVAVVSFCGTQSLSHLPYGGVTQLLKVIMSLHEGSSWLQEVVRGSDYGDVLLPLLEKLLPGTFASSAPGGQRRSIISADLVKDLLVVVLSEHCLVTTGGRYLVLAIDDVQWLDGLSLNVLFEVMDQLAPGMDKIVLGMMCTHLATLAGWNLEDTEDTASSLLSSDSDDMDFVFWKHIHNQRHITVTLDGMPRSEAMIHYRLYLNADSIDPSLVDLVFRNSDGNPYIAEQIILSLIELECVAVSADGEATLLRYDMDMADLVTKLNTIESITLKTLDHLMERLGEVLVTFMKVACVIGNTFDFQLLRLLFLGEHSTSALEGMCKELERRRVFMLVEENFTSNRLKVYTFKSSTLAVVLYNNMLLSERRELHHRVSRAMEQLIDNRDVPYTKAGLARHYELAEVHNKALKWYSEALREGMEKDSFSEVLGLLKKCIATAMARRDSERLEDDLPGSCPDTGRSSPPQGDRGSAYSATAPIHVETWRWQLIDFETLLGDLGRTREAFLHLSGIAGLSALPAQAKRERNPPKGFLCCVASPLPACDPSDIVGHLVASDIAVMMDDCDLLSVVTGRSRRGAKAPKLAGYACCADFLSVLCTLADVQMAKSSRKKMYRKARTQWLRVNAKAVQEDTPTHQGDTLHAWTVGRLACIASFSPDSDEFRRVCCVQNPTLVGLTKASTARINFIAPLFGTVRHLIRGDRDGAVQLLERTVVVSRRMRCRTPYLLSMLLSRALKVLYKLPSDAPRALSNSDDLLAAITETDPQMQKCLYLMASVATVAEYALFAHTFKRRISRLQSTASSHPPPSPVELIAKAVEHLEAARPVHLTPVVIPFFILFIDVSVWMVETKLLEPAHGVKHLRSLAPHASAVVATFPGMAEGLDNYLQCAVTHFDGKPLRPEKLQRFVNDATPILAQRFLLLGGSALETSHVRPELGTVMWCKSNLAKCPLPSTQSISIADALPEASRTFTTTSSSDDAPTAIASCAASTAIAVLSAMEYDDETTSSISESGL